MGEIRVTAVLVTGETIPVNIDENASVSGFLRLTMPEGVVIPSLGIHDGHILQPSLSLKFQNVKDGDSIVVYRRGVGAVVAVPYVQRKSFEQHVYSVVMEAYRLEYRRMRRLEASDSVSFELSSSDDEDESTYETVLGQSPDTLSEEPLPHLFDSDDKNSDEYVVPIRPYFKSVEDAGKFIMSEIGDQWSW